MTLYMRSSLFVFIINNIHPHSGQRKEKKKMVENLLNKKVIVRGTYSGIFFGTLIAKEGTDVKLENCRRIWYWDGTAKPKDCKFTVTVSEIIITDIIEIILCTDKAITSIEGVSVWKM